MEAPFPFAELALEAPTVVATAVQTGLQP